jgi:cellulose synthase/poly-beta-1,6-N-acetylglucosamine synthase-like glycosyltransferase
MRHKASQPWNLRIDKDYLPTVSILVPMHNEEKIVRFKLANLSKVEYPKKKLEIIIIDDASSDETVEEIKKYVDLHPDSSFNVLTNSDHKGKTHALNLGLKIATGDVIVVSDADCFFASDILLKTLPFLSDPTVGAVAGKETFLNNSPSLTMKSEIFFDKTMQLMRLGESKAYSTLFLGGGFTAYKRAFLQEFNSSVDDNGTALDIVQKNARTLLIPEALFYTSFPTQWRNKLSLKIRRASQMQKIWFKCLRLFFQRKLRLAKKIALPQIILNFLNPFVFIALAIFTVLSIFETPVLAFPFLAFFVPTLLISKTRPIIVEVIQNNLILLCAMLNIKARKFSLWKPVQESRLLLEESFLNQNNLI